MWTRSAVGMVIGSLVAVTIFSGAPATSAADGTTLTPQELQEDLLLMYGPTPDDWAPQGTLLATSGFDPAFNSFPFINYGGNMDFNTALGYDSGPVTNLTSIDAQRLFGTKRACTSGAGVDCVLTPPMMAYLSFLNSATDGGHCFGIAALVAGFFNGVISREGLTQSVVNIGVELSPAVQRMISSLFVTQLSLTQAQQAANALPPAQLVDQLIRFLPSGTLPYVLTLSWIEDGAYAGHGITPYAVYSRGPDLVDIAVYDNNYPLRARAVHVDLAKNTWSYEVQTNPGAAPTIAQGDAESLNLALVPLTQILQRQKCPICRDDRSGETMVNVVPSETGEGPFQVEILTPDGKPMPGVKGTDVAPNYGVLTVPSAQEFTVRVSTPGKNNGALYSVSVFGAGEAMVVQAENGADGVTEVAVDLATDTLVAAPVAQAAVASSSVSRDRRAIDGNVTVEFREATPRADEGPLVRISEKGLVQRVDFLGSRAMDAKLRFQRVSPAIGSIQFVVHKVRLRPGDRVETDLLAWHKGAPPEVIVTHANGKSEALNAAISAPDDYTTGVYERPYG